MFCPVCNSLCERIYAENENSDVISNVTYYCDSCWWDEQLVNAFFNNLRYHLSNNEDQIDYSDGF
jgi:formylmethanofuran dehydrogenase subunit B